MYCAQTYDQIYTNNYPFWGGKTALNYTSPLLHTAKLRGLNPATRYWYQVSGDNATFSREFSFVSSQAAGAHGPFPYLPHVSPASWGHVAVGRHVADKLVVTPSLHHDMSLIS